MGFGPSFPLKIGTAADVPVLMAVGNAQMENLTAALVVDGDARQAARELVCKGIRKTFRAAELVAHFTEKPDCPSGSLTESLVVDLDAGIPGGAEGDGQAALHEGDETQAGEFFEGEGFLEMTDLDVPDHRNLLKSDPGVLDLIRGKIVLGLPGESAVRRALGFKARSAEFHPGAIASEGCLEGVVLADRGEIQQDPATEFSGELAVCALP